MAERLKHSVPARILQQPFFGKANGVFQVYFGIFVESYNMISVGKEV